MAVTTAGNRLVPMWGWASTRMRGSAPCTTSHSNASRMSPRFLLRGRACRRCRFLLPLRRSSSWNPGERRAPCSSEPNPVAAPGRPSLAPQRSASPRGAGTPAPRTTPLALPPPQSPPEPLSAPASRSSRPIPPSSRLLPNPRAIARGRDAFGRPSFGATRARVSPSGKAGRPSLRSWRSTALRTASGEPTSSGNNRTWICEEAASIN